MHDETTRPLPLVARRMRHAGTGVLSRAAWVALPALLLAVAPLPVGAQSRERAAPQPTERAAPQSRDSMPENMGRVVPPATSNGVTSNANRSMAQPPAANASAAQTANPNNPDNMPMKKPDGRTNDAMTHKRLPQSDIAK